MEVVILFCSGAPVLWRCWLGGRKGIRPVKNWVVGCWCCYVWSEVQTCIWSSWCHSHSLSLASVKSRLVFTFLVPAHPGSPGQRAIKRVCVCVCGAPAATLRMLLSLWCVQTLLTAIEEITSSHRPLKRNEDSQFKAFVCLGLKWVSVLSQCFLLI